MAGQRLDAASEVGRRELGSGRRGDRSFRRVVFVAILTVVLLLSVASMAYATSNFYWYGEGNSTCWQTGQLGSPSTACDSVGAGYLPTPGGHTGGLEHMSEGGIGTDLKLSPSGDYCSYYRLGAELKYQDSTNEGGLSGITMPTPYSSYQEGDKTSSANNACQADGTFWGQAIRGVSGKGCTATCGMQHYVSFRSQGTSDKPWSSAFGEPSLVLSAEAGVTTFTYTTGTLYSGWGYVCPALEDTEPSFHGVIEYCLQEWRSTHNKPEWKNERIGECGGAGSAQVNTFFYPGTSYATEMPGSTNTFEVGSAGSGHFEAKITKTNLIKAVQLINAGCAGWHLSENPENYALVGVEQGLEGENGVSAMGGWAANLKLHTEYTPLPPEATTSAASEVKSTQAKLNGTVNPKGTDTHYYFQYGTTTSYGSSTSEVEAGSGTNNQAESTSLTGLPSGTHYHYRIVASNVVGTSYGGDMTFMTTKASFDGDDLADLIMCNNNEYSVALSNGTQLGAAGSQVWSKWACNQHAVVGDFNGDGKDDIVVPNESNNTWNVDLSTGSSFEAPGSGTWLTGWTAKPTWIGVGDFTGDGKDDLIMCNNNEYSVALSNGTQLGAAGSQVWSKWACNQHAVVGDFNGDGKDDIVVPNESNNTWNVDLSTGSSFEAPGSGTWLTGWTAKPTWIGVGDFTGDGKDDLIMCNNNEYSVALSNGTQLGAAGSQVWSKWACNQHAVVGDFNGDGKDDIVVPNESNNTWNVDLSTGSSFEAPGSGTWLTGWTAKPTWVGE